MFTFSFMVNTTNYNVSVKNVVIGHNLSSSQMVLTLVSNLHLSGMSVFAGTSTWWPKLIYFILAAPKLSLLYNLLSLNQKALFDLFKHINGKTFPDSIERMGGCSLYIYVFVPGS